MDEIRISWHPDITHLESGVFRDGGFWYLDTVDMRSALTAILKSILAKHGSGSHWLEVRPSDVGSLPVYH